jgi:Ni/Fe-hydrogenase subunit HybB-like protein
MPTKLYPLWYSPILPILFWLSAVSVGLAMVIFESGLSARAFGRALEFDLLQSVSKVMAGFLGLFLTVRFLDLAWRGALPQAFRLAGPGSYEARMFWLETALLALPILLLALPRVRANPQALFACSAVVVGGFLVNRLNVSTTGFDRSSGVHYFPSWMEIAVTMSIVVVGMNLFRIATRYLPVFHDATHGEKPRQAAYAES